MRLKTDKGANDSFPQHISSSCTVLSSKTLIWLLITLYRLKVRTVHSTDSVPGRSAGGRLLCAALAREAHVLCCDRVRVRGRVARTFSSWRPRARAMSPQPHRSASPECQAAQQPPRCQESPLAPALARDRAVW